MANNTSPHILSTAANLLGFCLFVITSIHISNTAQLSFIDEITSVIAVLLVFSCLLSFYSIKTKNIVREQKLETIADNIFVVALIGILIVVLLIVFNFIK
jgi:membrane protease YdiL (CAAX protease family)